MSETHEWFCDECQEYRKVVDDTDAVVDPPETTLRCVVCSHPIAEFRPVSTEPFYRAIHEPGCSFRLAGAPHPCTCAGARP